VIIPEASLNSFVRVEYAICGLPKRQRCSTPLEQRAPLEFVEWRLIWEGRVDRFDLITRFSFAEPGDSQSQTLRVHPGALSYDTRARTYRAGLVPSVPPAKTTSATSCANCGSLFPANDKDTRSVSAARRSRKPLCALYLRQRSSLQIAGAPHNLSDKSALRGFCKLFVVRSPSRTSWLSASRRNTLSKRDPIALTWQGNLKIGAC
jgi:hypothetical protein